MTKQMDTVCSTTPTATPTTACGSTIKLTVGACTNMRMVLATPATGSKTANMVKGVKHGLMEQNMKAATKMERKTVKVNLCSLTQVFTPGSFSKMKSKARVSIAGPTVKHTMVNGCATKCTVRVS